MQIESSNVVHQGSHEEYDDNKLPSVASGLVNTVLQNVNNQLASGTLDLDDSENYNLDLEITKLSEAVDLSPITSPIHNNENGQPVISRTSATMIPEIESAMKEITDNLEDFVQTTKTIPEISAENGSNEGLETEEGVEIKESVASMGSNAIPENYSQDSFDVSVKESGLPAVDDSDDKAKDMDLQRTRSGTPLLENSVSEDVVEALVGEIAMETTEPVVTIQVIQESVRESPEISTYQTNHLDLGRISLKYGFKVLLFIA